MAKKLINHYRIDVDNNVVEIEDNILPEALLIISDVESNTILYNFANPAAGYVTRSFDETTEYTSFELVVDMAAAGVTDSTRLQIFIEETEPKIDVAESLLDPVNKIRVSNPENLIDTDFEYGLQSTKWETLELSNNVPSYYVSDSDLPLDNVASVTATTGSDVITVRCKEPHGLVVGTPIDVRGLTSRTAEGKFLISSAQDNTFTYKGTAVQTANGIISNVYTTITPGQFYSGSQIPFSQDVGIKTNERNPATITVTTPYPHGYVVGSNFYLVNTVGTKQVRIEQTTGTAPDGRPYVDFTNFLTTQFENVSELTETKQKRSTYSRKFNAGSVDVNSNSIVWNNHNLRNNDCLLYVPSSGDDPIGGLQRFQVYYVRNATTSTFQLSSTYNGGAINFTDAGTYNFGRGSLHLCYEIRRLYKPNNNYLTYYYTSAWQYGTNNNSGWDFYDNQYGNTGRGNFGQGNKIPSGKIVFTPNNAGISTTAVRYWYGTNQNSQMVMPETSDVPGNYNFIEDWQRYSDGNNYRAFATDNMYGYTSGGFYSYYDNQFNYSSGTNQYFNRGQVFVILLEDDDEGDTFYYENHGLADGSEIELVDPTPPDPGEGPTFSSNILGDLQSLASTLSGLSAGPNNFGSVTAAINNQVNDFNVFAIAQQNAMAEQLPGIASADGVHPGTQAGFVYNTSNGNYLGSGNILSDFSGGAAAGYSAADGKKWMAAAMYANNVFQGLMVWVFTGDRINQSNGITSGQYNIQRTADFFYPDVGNYEYHRIYSFIIAPNGTIQASDFTGNQGWRFSNNQVPNQFGYQATTRFASDDGFWAFAMGGRKVDGNTPGPTYATTQGYGFGNYNGGDSGAGFYWNGSSLTFNNYVGFIFSGDGTGGQAFNPSGLIAKSTQSTNLFDTSGNVNLSYGDYLVKVVDQNRFRLASTNGTEYRIVQATGDYQFIGNKINETANTFYAPGHGYNGNEEVEVATVDGGVLPSTTSGPIDPKANVTSGTTDEAWAIFDTYLTNYSQNEASVRDIVLSPFANSSQYVSEGVASGNASWLRYLQNAGGYMYDQQVGTGTSTNYQVYQSTGFNSSEVKEVGLAPYQNGGFGIIGTDFETSKAVPHFSWLLMGNANESPHELRQYLSSYANTGQTTFLNSNVQLTSNGDSNWRCTVVGYYVNGDSTRQGHVVYQVRVWNNSWNNFNAFHYAYTYGSGSTNQFTYCYGTSPRYFTLSGIMGLTTSTSWSTTTLQNFMQGCAQYFADNFAYPDLQPGSSQLVKVVNSDRFGLKSTAGFSVDLADAGSPTITFTERGVIGALDGAYTVTSVPTENTMQIALPFSAPATTITFDSSTISSDLIQLGTPHNFSPGSPVTYLNNGNADISGLVSEATYYVYVADDFYIGLANSYLDAINGAVNTISASAGSESHLISFTTTNGRLKGAGTVTTTENSKLVLGDDDTLFKRYFKVGDTIGIKDNSNTPGSISNYIIQAIADDQTLEVTDIIPFAASGTSYFLETAMYARPDGYAVHRPFDGGVEIAAGTAPFSQIRRQTRKYFRYQSGKGIQTSLAINFNPPVQFQTLTSAVDLNKTAKCDRDIGYFLDGVGYDVALGTNYNSIFLGIAESNSLDINQTVLNAIGEARDRTLALSNVAGSATATSRASNFWAEVLNITENGRSVASSHTYTNPTNATSSQIAAKDKMIANLDFITAEINAYVEANYGPTDHDIAKCTRDIKYAIYSFCYDILYGGISATYDNAKFFYYFDSGNNPGIDPSHKKQTVAAYDHLADILPDIVQGTLITPSAGNTEAQDTSGNNASVGDGAIIANLSDIIRNVVRYGKAYIDGSGNAETLFVTADGTSQYVINGFDQFPLTIVRGVTYTIDVSAVGHPFWIKTAATTGTGDQYNTGVTNNGTENGIITWTVDAGTPSTLYYQCEVHSAMGGTINVVDKPTKTYPSVTWASSELQNAKSQIDSNKTSIITLSVPDIYAATGTTRYPHRLSAGQSILVTGSTDVAFNGEFFVNEIVDEFTFKFTLDSIPSSGIPNGIIQYNLNGYQGAYTRAGMFDFQNGFFFEFNGSDLYCVRRSSTQQLSGVVEVTYNGNIVTGTNTNFIGQLQEQDKIVIRGGTYKVVKINSRNELVIQPQYKGISASNVILTKTVDVKVPQAEWNVDTCDGFGPSGFNLNINKIQMAYMDYSWYGAGKVRFGFKDRKGHVKYVHSFLHNNRLDEAYMRSGNIPAAYEIENDSSPSYAPTLFHWGTSVIMDGRFDEDDAYLFTATSKTLTFTNGQASSVTTNANSTLVWEWNRSARSYDWWVELSFSSSSASKFSSGVPLYTANGELNGEEVDYTEFDGGSIKVYIYITRSRNVPSVYPTVPNGTPVSIGAPASGGTSEISLGTATIPLVTLRLAPSVDSSLSGELGAREIINRMQLKLNEVGLILTHDCEVALILNGDLSSINWQNVNSPSLSQLITHNAGEKVIGGTEVFSFRASGGSTDNTGKRLANTSNFSLGSLIDMGNSILGGNGVFPNGPDILTVAVRLVNTADVSANSPFVASARITWSESQA